MSEVLQASTLESDAWKRGRALVEPLLAAARPVTCLIAVIDRLERIKEQSARAEQCAALEAHLRARTELASATFARQEQCFWIIVPGVAAKDSTALARSLVEGVRKAHLGAARCTISLGVAAGRPGLRAEVLFKVAEEGMLVARNGGGDRAVHTDLYDLLQKKLTGEALPAFKASEPHTRSTLRPLESATQRAVVVPSDGLGASAAVVVPLSGDDHGHQDVELLERRIAKLVGELAQAEDRITQLEHSTSGGIASIYREVQGLAPTERLFEQKRDLMASIFEANLALRSRIAS